MPIPDPIGWTGDGAVRILDQTLLPGEERYITLDTVDAVAEAIRTLRVRGAPLIGIAAAMGVTLALRGGSRSLDAVCAAAAALGATRPTAVNLRWALERMERRAAAAAAMGEDLTAALRQEADAIREEDRAMCARIGAAGAELIGGDALVLTHCNAGALATGGIGTALAPIYALHEAGRRVCRSIADETRPLLQGSRLTAWELTRAGVPVHRHRRRHGREPAAAGRRHLRHRRRRPDRRQWRRGQQDRHLRPRARRAGARGAVLRGRAELDDRSRLTPDGARIPIEQRGAEEVTGWRGARGGARRRPGRGTRRST